MNPIKSTLVSTAAAIALMAGAANAQTSVTTDTNAGASTGLGDAQVGNSTAATSDSATDTLNNTANDGVAAADSAADKVGDAADKGMATAGDAAETVGDKAEDGLAKAGDVIERTGDAANDATSDTASTTIDNSAGNVSGSANATADTSATTGAAGTDGTATAGATGEVTAGTLRGVEVASSSGEKIGEIDDVVRVNDEVMAVVGVGGFLGLGERSVALPLTELDWQGETVTAFGYSQEQLETMEEFDAEVATSLDDSEPVMMGGKS